MREGKAISTSSLEKRIVPGRGGKKVPENEKHPWRKGQGGRTSGKKNLLLFPRLPTRKEKGGVLLFLILEEKGQHREKNRIR